MFVENWKMNKYSIYLKNINKQKSQPLSLSLSSITTNNKELISYIQYSGSNNKNTFTLNTCFDKIKRISDNLCFPRIYIYIREKKDIEKPKWKVSKYNEGNKQRIYIYIHTHTKFHFCLLRTHATVAANAPAPIGTIISE